MQATIKLGLNMRKGFVSEVRLAPYVHDRHRPDHGVCACCWRTVSPAGRLTLIPLRVDGLICGSSMVLDAARTTSVPVLARWLLGLGIAGTLASNVAHGLGHGPVGAAVAAWPAVALAGSCELLMMVIRGSQAVPDAISDSVNNPEPLGEQAAKIFAGQLAADCVPSVRSVRSRMLAGPGRSGCGLPRHRSCNAASAPPSGAPRPVVPAGSEEA